MGRTPLPDHVRLISSGKKTVNVASEIDATKLEGPKTAEFTVPEPPAELHESARAYWDHYAIQLKVIGVFTEPDTQALAMLANLTEEFWRADERERAVPENAENKVRWTAISHKRSVEKQLKVFLDAFGLTPAARVKVRGG